MKRKADSGRKGMGGIEALAEAPSVLLPYQQRWIADQAPVKFCEKSRRVGITWAEAADDVLFAATDGKAGDDVLYISYNQDMTREYIDTCATWARHFNKAATEVKEFLFLDEGEKEIKAFRIDFASGHKIMALSSRPTNLRGKQGRVVIDEAAFVENLGELLKAALALLMWGGQVRVISTHNGEENEFNSIILEIRAGKKPYGLHRITLDNALEEGLFRRICLVRGIDWSAEAEGAWRQTLIDQYGEAAGEELFCTPGHGSGAFFHGALVEACMSEDIPVLRWSCRAEFAERAEALREAAAKEWCESMLGPVVRGLDGNRPTYFGEDFGRSGDLTVILPLQEGERLKYRAACAIELRNIPFRQQEQVLFWLVDRLPRFRGGALDARGNGQYLAEVAMQRYGAWRIQQVMLSVEWYRDNMPRYRAAFEDGAILLPRDGDILDDHRAVRMERGVAKVPEGYKGKGRDGAQRHGDSAVAGALGWFAATQTKGGPIEFESTGIKRESLGTENF